MFKLLIIQFRMHWEGNHPFRQPIGHWQIGISGHHTLKHLLAVSRHGIIDHGRNTLFCQILVQAVAINPFQLQGVLMKNVGTI